MKTKKPPIWRRALWHLNRTPLARPIKALRRATLASTIAARRQLVQQLQATAAERAQAEHLNREGYAIVTDLLDPAALAAMAAAGARKYARASGSGAPQSAANKAFWSRLLDEDMQDGTLSTDDPFVAFALQRPVLSVIASAYGELPRLDYVLLTLSRPTAGPLAVSQLWHRDHDDTRVIKLFVYLTDVASLDDGPFTFLPGPTSDRFGFSRKSHRQDDAIFGKVPRSEMQVLIKPRLTAFLVETSRCMHMGSRVAPEHDRLLYTATFISVPRMYPEPPPRFRLTGREGEVVRRVLAAD